jgi:hypothetical protein
MEREGSAKEALAYYERVYVAYGKFADLVAQAYWHRGQALESLGLAGEAREVYAELVSREDLAGFPEAAGAARRLAGTGDQPEGEP